MPEEENSNPELEQFERVLNPEGLGSLLFNETEVKLILGNTPESFSKQVLKGRLLTEAKVRHVIIQQAQLGSSEAQKIVINLAADLRLVALKNSYE